MSASICRRLLYHPADDRQRKAISVSPPARSRTRDIQRFNLIVLDELQNRFRSRDEESGVSRALIKM